MSYEVLPLVARALDLAIIERLPNAGYFMVAPAPAWLEGALEEKATLARAFPFLRHFLETASATWEQGGAARANSGPFEAEISGDALLLRATAMTIDTHRILVIERMTGEADLRPLLQRAREHMLEHEQLERRASAVHAPASAIARDIATLAALPLPADAAALVKSITQSSAALHSAIAALPAPPSRGKRKLTK